MTVPTEAAASDPRWITYVGDGHILLTIDPEADISDAFASLVPSDRRHLWTIEPLDDITPNGWDTWRLSRY